MLEPMQARTEVNLSCVPSGVPLLHVYTVLVMYSSPPDVQIELGRDQLPLLGFG